MDGMAASEKQPPIYSNLPKHANYVNFVPPKLNEKPKSCRLHDANDEKRDESLEGGQVHNGKERVYCSGAAKSDEDSKKVSTQVFSLQDAAHKTDQPRDNWCLTSTKIFRDFSGSSQVKALPGQLKGGGAISSMELKEEGRKQNETDDSEAKPPNGKDAADYYTPLYGRRESECEYQRRTTPSEATRLTMGGDLVHTRNAPLGLGCDGENDSRAANNTSPRAFRCLIILLIFVGLLSVEAIVLASLPIVRGQVSVVNNASGVPNHTPTPIPDSVVTYTTSEAGEKMMSLNTCEYKLKSSWSVKAGPTAMNYVTLIEEKGFKVLGVSCSTSGAQEYILKSAMKQQRLVFICECRGSSSLFTQKTNKMKCFLHYWECTTTETPEEHGRPEDETVSTI